MKIVYAAGEHSTAKLQLLRFLEAVGDRHKIKIAAFKKSSPKGINIDWTLDCLKGPNDSRYRTLNFVRNENYELYKQSLQSFNPDLIISDLEYFTSMFATDLHVKIWQCSSYLITRGLNLKAMYALGIHRKYALLFAKTNVILDAILGNADRKMIYSHFGDLLYPPDLNDHYEWVRPYFKLGEPYWTCRHNVVAAGFGINKKLVRVLEKVPDSVLFSDFSDENHNVLMKNLNNQEEYFCNLFNSKLFLTEGQTSFLSDAYYNGKYAVVYPNFQETECVLNAVCSEYCDLSKTIYSNNIDLSNFLDEQIKSTINPRIKFLHEKIEEL